MKITRERAVNSTNRITQRIIFRTLTFPCCLCMFSSPPSWLLTLNSQLLAGMPYVSNVNHSGCCWSCTTRLTTQPHGPTCCNKGCFTSVSKHTLQNRLTVYRRTLWYSNHVHWRGLSGVNLTLHCWQDFRPPARMVVKCSLCCLGLGIVSLSG